MAKKIYKKGKGGKKKGTKPIPLHKSQGKTYANIIGEVAKMKMGEMK